MRRIAMTILMSMLSRMAFAHCRDERNAFITAQAVDTAEATKRAHTIFQKCLDREAEAGDPDCEVAEEAVTRLIDVHNNTGRERASAALIACRAKKQDQDTKSALTFSLAICVTQRQVQGSRRFADTLKRSANMTTRRRIAVEDQQEGQRGLRWAVQQMKKRAARAKVKLLSCSAPEVKRLMGCVANDRDKCPDDRDFDSKDVEDAQSIEEEVWRSAEKEN